MFELKRSHKITEQIKLGDEIIDISLDTGEIAARFIQCHNGVIKAQDAIKNVNKDNSLDGMKEQFEQYGNAVISMLQVIFGNENTDKLLAFYEKNYTEMFAEIYPFISTVILPKVMEAAKERSKIIKAMYRK